MKNESRSHTNATPALMQAVRPPRLILLETTCLLIAGLLTSCSTTAQTGSALTADTRISPVNSAQAAAEGHAYPAEIHGQWEPGPNPCRLPLTYDSDSGFKITPDLLQGYEHTNAPKRVQTISRSPLAWRIEAAEKFDGNEIAVTDIFVVEGDYLTVTDGQRSTTYRKCY